MMKKKIGSLLIVCCTLLLTATAGYVTGLKNNQKDLPKYESTALYPAFSLPELTDESTFIVEAEVVEVGDTIMREIPVSLTENHEDATETLSYPVTPITLAIHSSIKGDNIGNEFIYYEEGGITSTYIQLPDGYAMEDGLEVILFLNSNGYCWGAQSIFPVVGENVILNNMAIEYVGEDNVSVLETQTLNSNIRSQIDAQNINVMPTDDFISAIQSIVEK
ncbi:MAG: hypothetical protein K1W35_03155 [Lachnospiraceae bacterium]